MSDRQSWELRSPRGNDGTKQGECATRVRQLRGLRIGFVDNGFPNAGVVVARLRDRFNERFELSGVVNYRRRRSTGYLEPADLLDELASQCDAIVLGVGT